MSEHLRLAGRPQAEQVAAVEAFLRDEPVMMAVLEGLRNDRLPDQLLVAGAIYNLVWNRLTGRPALAGINDIDVFYFDPDTSWEAEDVVIKRLAARFADLPLPVQVRNQARVHLWFPQKFEVTDFAPADLVGGNARSLCLQDPCGGCAARGGWDDEHRRAVRARRHLFLSRGAQSGAAQPGGA